MSLRPPTGSKSTWIQPFCGPCSTGSTPRSRTVRATSRREPLPALERAAMEGAWAALAGPVRHPPPGAQREHPFGRFEAVYTDSGGAGARPHRGTTRGETLTGVPREVFERSAFVGQGARPSTAPPPGGPHRRLASSGGGCVLLPGRAPPCRTGSTAGSTTRPADPRLEEGAGRRGGDLSRQSRPSVWPRRPGGSWRLRPSTGFTSGGTPHLSRAMAQRRSRWEAARPLSRGPGPGGRPGGRHPHGASRPGYPERAQEGSTPSIPSTPTASWRRPAGGPGGGAGPGPPQRIPVPRPDPRRAWGRAGADAGRRAAGPQTRGAGWAASCPGSGRGGSLTPLRDAAPAPGGAFRPF